jgi:signal transduction histidine kinase
MANEGIRLLDAVAREAETVGSLFRSTLQGRDALLDFLDVNNWFGMAHSGDGTELRIASLDPMKDALTLWLRAYGRSREEKIDLLLEAYAPVFPQTCLMFRSFSLENGCKGLDSTWKILDFMFSAMDRELCDYDEAGIRRFIMQANRELSIAAMRQLTAFLNLVRNEHWGYQFQSRRIEKPENGAYSLEQFSVMAWTIFNADSWREHDLVQKAAEKRRYAELWLFTALHFVCAVRKTDLVRLPVPSLPCAPQELRDRICGNQFSRAEARAISEELLYRLELKPLKPNKTSRSSRIPHLKLFIPESVLEPFGIILALSLSWREPEDPFVSTRADISDIRTFFGEEFATAVGNRRFLSRRANKAYLQGIEAAMNNMLTRMHDTYLQQARFVNDASHELRTPISVIQGYANMLDRWGKEDEEILEESIAAIKNESDHMNHLVEQLLFLARGDAGRNPMTFEDVSLNEVMREIYEESLMIDEDHVYKYDEKAQDVHLNADASMIKQAMRILVDNAAKYTSKGDDIVLSVGFEAVESEDNGRKETKYKPYIQVQDSGIGMAEVDVKHMFERFYRADDTRKVQGTGLGLSIAKWIVDKHNGHFEIVSRKEIGTRIRIVFTT